MAGAPVEPAGDENRLARRRDAEPLQFVDRGGECATARVARRSGQRQLRRLDDERRRAAARDERLERRAGEREAERVADGRGDVDDSSRGPARPQHDAVADVHDRDRASRTGSGPVALRDVAVQAEERLPEAALRPEAGREQVGDAPVGDHDVVAPLPGPRERGLGERDARRPSHGLPDPSPPSRAGRRRQAGRARSGRSTARPGTSSNAPTMRPSRSTTRSPTSGFARSSRISAAELVRVLARAAVRERRASAPGGRKHRGQRDQRVDVALLRAPDALRPLALGHLADTVRVLLAEPDARPGAEEGRVVRGSHRVVAHVALVDPAPGRGAVEVAEVLRLLDGVAGELDPDVVAPDRVGPRRARAGTRRRGRRAGRRSLRRRRNAQRLDLGLCRGGVLEPLGKQRLGRVDAPGDGPPAARRRGRRSRRRMGESRGVPSPRDDSSRATLAQPIWGGAAAETLAAASRRDPLRRGASPAAPGPGQEPPARSLRLDARARARDEDDLSSMRSPSRPAVETPLDPAALPRVRTACRSRNASGT